MTQVCAVCVCVCVFFFLSQPCSAPVTTENVCAKKSSLFPVSTPRCKHCVFREIFPTTRSHFIPLAVKRKDTQRHFCKRTTLSFYSRCPPHLSFNMLDGCGLNIFIKKQAVISIFSCNDLLMRADFFPVNILHILHIWSYASKSACDHLKSGAPVFRGFSDQSSPCW